MSGVGFVSWELVESIYVLNIPVANQVMVGLRVKKLGEILTNKSWVVKRLTNANISGGLPPITINLNSAKETPTEVADVMNRYLGGWRMNN